MGRKIAIALCALLFACSSVRDNIETMSEPQFQALKGDVRAVGDSVGVLLKSELDPAQKVVVTVILNNTSRDIQNGIFVSNMSIREYVFEVMNVVELDPEIRDQVRLGLNLLNSLVGEINVGHVSLTDRQKELVVTLLASLVAGLNS